MKKSNFKLERYKFTAVVLIFAVVILSVFVFNFCKKDHSTLEKNSHNLKSGISQDTCYGYNNSNEVVRLILSRQNDTVFINTSVIQDGPAGVGHRIYLYDVEPTGDSIVIDKSDTSHYWFIPMDSNNVCHPWYKIFYSTWMVTCHCIDNETGQCNAEYIQTENYYECIEAWKCGCCETWAHNFGHKSSEDLSLSGSYVFIRASVINYNGHIIK